MRFSTRPGRKDIKISRKAQMSDVPVHFFNVRVLHEIKRRMTLTKDLPISIGTRSTSDDARSRCHRGTRSIFVHSIKNLEEIRTRRT